MKSVHPGWKLSSWSGVCYSPVSTYWEVSLSWELPCPVRNNPVGDSGNELKGRAYRVSKKTETDKLRIKSRKGKCIFLWPHCEAGQWDTITSSVHCKFPKVRLEYGKKGHKREHVSRSSLDVVFSKTDPSLSLSGVNLSLRKKVLLWLFWNILPPAWDSGGEIPVSGMHGFSSLRTNVSLEYIDLCQASYIAM